MFNPIRDQAPLSKAEIRATKTDRASFVKLERIPLYIILDSLKCAHNIGTILRLSDALMVRKVFICGDTLIPPHKKIKLSSKGAEKWVPWEYHASIVDVITELKQAGVLIVSAELAHASIPYDQVSYTLPLAIVLGRETEGVSAEALNLSDAIVHLPMYGMCNSINVSTAAAVLMYAAHKSTG